MIGLYIHIPFCKKRCGYCDFTTYTGSDHFMAPYIAALEKEVKQRLSGLVPDTIFIGGGTPTALDDESFAHLMRIIRPLCVSPEQEITIEANPESVTPQKVHLMKEGGINRISMGLQSTDDLILKNIGRIHNFDTFLRSYRLLREEGFDNVSFDLITALPGQDEAVIRDTIEKALALRPQHISVYSLIVEEGTPFYTKVQSGELELPDEESDRLFQDLFRENLEEAGLMRYEISNYARPGMASRHNLNYWNFGDYIGCGVAAAGFLDGVRWTNTKSVPEYIEKMNSKADVRDTVHINSREDSMEEFIFMGLRKTQGISLDEFRARFNEDFFAVYPGVSDRFLNNGLMVHNGSRLYLTDRGLDVSNYIMSDYILTQER